MKQHRSQPHPIIHHHHFTLPEVVAVVCIIGLISALALPLLRSPSPATKLEQTAQNFELFCARVRYQAMEHGKDRIVSFDPGSKCFFMRSAEDTETSGKPEPENSASAELKWKLPEGYESSQGDSFSSNTDHIDIFRFYPDGGASPLSKLQFRHDKFVRIFEISLLTGSLRSRESEEGEEVEF